MCDVGVGGGARECMHFSQSKNAHIYCRELFFYSIAQPNFTHSVVSGGLYGSSFRLELEVAVQLEQIVNIIFFSEYVRGF